MEWCIYIDSDDRDQVPHLVIKERGGSLRIPTKAEYERAACILNEEGSSVIRLHCRNAVCTDHNSWIERSRKDAEKNKYYCMVCGKPMER